MFPFWRSGGFFKDRWVCLSAVFHWYYAPWCYCSYHFPLSCLELVGEQSQDSDPRNERSMGTSQHRQVGPRATHRLWQWRVSSSGQWLSVWQGCTFTFLTSGCSPAVPINSVAFVVSKSWGRQAGRWKGIFNSPDPISTCHCGRAGVKVQPWYCLLV